MQDQLSLGQTYSVKTMFRSAADPNNNTVYPTVPAYHNVSHRCEPTHVEGQCTAEQVPSRWRSRREPILETDDTDPCPLTQKQLAARQAISKELPPFSGKPEEWPIFLSSFTNTTAMCGFTDAENAVRLQKSLTGKAYDAVKSSLMHPSNVKGVLATL